jgi:excisionase family DNA binding protein
MTRPRGVLLTADAVAERLTVPVSTVYRLIRRGDLAAHDLGTGRRRNYRVSEQQLDDYLSAHLARSA